MRIPHEYKYYNQLNLTCLFKNLNLQIVIIILVLTLKFHPLRVHLYLQVFPSSSCYPCSKDGTPYFHVHLVKGIHNRFDPVVVNFCKEHLDRLFGCWTRRIGANSGRRSRSCRRGRGGGLMQQQELDVAAGDEAGDVVVEEFVDALQVPVVA